LELLALNIKESLGSRDPGHDPSRKIFSGVLTPDGTVSRNMHAKFDVRTFRYFGAISI